MVRFSGVSQQCRSSRDRPRSTNTTPTQHNTLAWHWFLSSTPHPYIAPNWINIGWRPVSLPWSNSHRRSVEDIIPVCGSLPSSKANTHCSRSALPCHRTKRERYANIFSNAVVDYYYCCLRGGVPCLPLARRSCSCAGHRVVCGDCGGGVRFRGERSKEVTR